ncbi:MAG: NAD-dependent protein deacetylase [Bradymonadaceae bacterium]
MDPVPDRTSDLENLGALADLLRHRETVLLTGAGCSTESGIPDYRGPATRDTHPEPITYAEFIDSAETRRRYWARAMVGWPRFAAADPNAAHQAMAQLEESGHATGVITQNVDTLHRQAGSQTVVDLHGRLADVRCLDCDRLFDRGAIQAELHRRNPERVGERAELRPDGDAHLPEEAPQGFDFPACPDCTGVLKPDVVFFGESVADDVVDAAFRLLDRSEALLVVGSSLEVWSSYRFVRRAAERHMPVGIVNLGETRGDEEAWLKVEALVGEAMPALVDRLDV